MDLMVNIETRQGQISNSVCLSVCISLSLFLYGRCPCYPREAEESMDLTVNTETRQAQISQLSLSVCISFSLSLYLYRLI